MSAAAVIKSIKYRFIVFGSMTIALLILYSCLNQTFLKTSGNNMEGMVEVIRNSNSNNPITYEYYQSHQVPGLEKMTAYNELLGDISNTSGIVESNVKLTRIDAQYNSIYRKPMLAGTFPDSEDIEVGKQYAVISDVLSVKLFKSINTVGNEVNIFNKKYTVIGIYYSNKSTLWSLFGDGLDRVFVPYTSVDKGLQEPIDVLALNLRQLENQTIVTVNDILKANFGNRFKSYAVIDYTGKYIALSQYNSVILFVLGLIAIISTLLFMTKFLIVLSGRIKSRENEYYFFKSLRAESKSIILFVAILVLGGTAIIYLAKLIRFKYYIPDSYIPFDNIFDFKFYAQQVVSEIKEKNTVLNSSYSYLHYIYKNVLHFNTLINTMIILLLIVAMSFFKLLKIGEVKPANTLTYVFTVLVAGSLTGLALSFALGLEITVPIRTLIITGYFFLISAIPIKSMLKSD